MNQNEMMTVGAVAFAGFALWYVFRRNPATQGLAAQPGQAARDAGLEQWLDDLRGQWTLPTTSYSLSSERFASFLTNTR